MACAFVLALLLDQAVGEWAVFLNIVLGTLLWWAIGTLVVVAKKGFDLIDPTDPFELLEVVLWPITLVAWFICWGVRVFYKYASKK